MLKSLMLRTWRIAVKNPGTLKNPVIQNALGLQQCVIQRLICASLSNNSVYQNPRVADSQETCYGILSLFPENKFKKKKKKKNQLLILEKKLFFGFAIFFSLRGFRRYLLTFSQRSGIRASYMASNEFRRDWLITIVPSIANFKSLRVVFTSIMTCCILSISCRRKMFIGSSAPILCKASFT